MNPPPTPDTFSSLKNANSETTLCLVATPIGNLRDITARAIEILRSADFIVAEDTRHSRKLLAHLNLDTTRLHRLDANATDRDLQRVVNWLQQGKQVALITDAGMPCISDPGNALVRSAISNNISITCAPGPSAVTMAVACSGLVNGPFYFAGFPPRQPVELASFIHDLSARTEPCVLFEAPHRTSKTLQALATAMAQRQVVVGRELTKAFEQFVRGTLEHVCTLDLRWMGEITIVLGPWQHDHNQQLTSEQIDQYIDHLLKQGKHTRTVASIVAAWSGANRREIYARVVLRANLITRTSAWDNDADEPCSF